MIKSIYNTNIKRFYSAKYKKNVIKKIFSCLEYNETKIYKIYVVTIL